MRITKNGFTLLEIMLAVLILAISMVGLIWAINAGIFSSTDIDNVDLALNVAQSKMEEIKNTSYSSIASAVKSAVPGISGFQQSVNVTNVYTNLKQVDVTVYWSTRGAETNVSLSTYVANG